MYSPQKLKEIRDKRGLTQKGLAAYCQRQSCDLTWHAIREFEAGNRSGSQIIPLISIALKVPLRAFKADAVPKNGKKR